MPFLRRIYSLNHQLTASCRLFLSPPDIATKKGSISASLKGNRQRPILPGRVQPSTFGTGELNYCVRYGNRWDLSVITTGRFSGGFRSFPSAPLPSCFPFGPLALRFASGLSRTLSLLLPASLRSLPFLPFRALRSTCSVPRSSASSPFPSVPLPSFRLSASLPIPSLSTSLRFPSLSLRSSGCFQLCTFQCTLTTAQVFRFNIRPSHLISLFLSSGFRSGLRLLSLPSSFPSAFRVCYIKRLNQALDRLVSTTYMRYRTSSVDLSPGSPPGVLLLADGSLILEVGFTLRCFQRLSRPYFASLLCRWHDNSCTSGMSIPVLSY